MVRMRTRLRAAWAPVLALAALALAGLAPAGCAAIEVPPGAALRPAANEALVVLSITHSGQRGHDLLLQIDGPGSGAGPWLWQRAFGYHRDWRGAPGDQGTPADDPDGRLYVLKLAPGTYRIDRWMGRSEAQGMSGDGYQIYSEPLGVSFTAAAGRVTYVGNVHLAVPGEIDYLADLNEATMQFAINDRRQRDLDVLRARYPDAGAVDPQPRLATSPRAGLPLRYHVFNLKAGGDFE